MKISCRLAALLPVLLLSACMSRPSGSPSIVEVPPGTPDGQLEFQLSSGSYVCDQGVRVGVKRERDQQRDQRVTVLWRGQPHVLDRDHSYSGLPRFEDRRSGLVWIDLPWKSVLLDGRTQKPLATDCHLV